MARLRLQVPLSLPIDSVMRAMKYLLITLGHCAESEVFLLLSR